MGRDGHSIQVPLPDGSNERRAFNEFITGGAKQPAFGYRPNPVAGASYALEPCGNGPWRANLTHQIHKPDVYAEFQGGRRHHDSGLPFFKAFLGGQANPARQAAMMCDHVLRAQPVGEVMGNTFGQPACVDEHQGGAVFLNQLRETVIDVGPDGIGGHCTKFILGGFHGQVHFPLWSNVDDGTRAFPPRFPRPFDFLLGVPPHQESCDFFQRLLGGRQTDSGGRGVGEGVKPFQRESQMRPPFIGRDRMNFIHDHRSNIPQNVPAFLSGHQEKEGLGRGDQNMRGPLEHLPPVFCRGVPSSHFDPQLGKEAARCQRDFGNLGQWLLKVFLNVVA